MTDAKPVLNKTARKLLWVGLDAVLLNLAMVLAQVLRYSTNISYAFFHIYIRLAPVMTVVCLLVFWVCGMYRTMWQHATAYDVLRIAAITLLGAVLTYACSLVLNGLVRPANMFRLHRMVYLLFWLTSMAFVAGSRMLYCIIVTKERFPLRRKGDVRRVMIVGAGRAGANAVHQMQRGSYGACVPVLVVDDDRTRSGARLSGVPVVRGSGNILKLASDHAIDEIIIAIATPHGDLKPLIEKCMATGCRVRRLRLAEDVHDQSRAAVRDLDIGDLLGRPEERLDMSRAAACFQGKTVLITGGGGSIGSELCRRLLPLEPERVVLYDINENYMYDLMAELRLQYGDALNGKLILCVGSVRDPERLDEIFSYYKPQIVLHAAAHKHVPLMEDCPTQAVKNNVFGTWHAAQAAIHNGAERFLLISTDKAVNPTNVMGATKRVAEMIIEGLNGTSQTVFTAVRFGNVLGSHGSVVPLFERQIRAGGPVTLTHPDIIRYFMTIPEAASLVLQAASLAEGGEVFVLDMGQPVRIRELAERMIQLYGDHRKIEIVYTGLRPGEKLYEELLSAGEGNTRTENEKIFVAKPENVALEEVEATLKRFETCLGNEEEALACLREVVPTFHDADTVNAQGVPQKAAQA